MSCTAALNSILKHRNGPIHLEPCFEEEPLSRWDAICESSSDDDTSQDSSLGRGLTMTFTSSGLPMPRRLPSMDDASKVVSGVDDSPTSSKAPLLPRRLPSMDDANKLLDILESSIGTSMSSSIPMPRRIPSVNGVGGLLVESSVDTTETSMDDSLSSLFNFQEDTTKQKAVLDTPTTTPSVTLPLSPSLSSSSSPALRQFLVGMALAESSSATTTTESVSSYTIQTPPALCIVSDNARFHTTNELANVLSSSQSTNSDKKQVRWSTELEETKFIPSLMDNGDCWYLFNDSDSSLFEMAMNSPPQSPKGKISTTNKLNKKWSRLDDEDIASRNAMNAPQRIPRPLFIQ